MYRLSEEWFQIKEIVLYGFGTMARKGIGLLMKEFSIPFIIDNDDRYQGEKYQELDIVNLKKAREKLGGKKIVICSSGENYRNMKNSLEDIGLCEYRDFSDLMTFIGEWFWRVKQEVWLLEVHTTVTTKCSLNCRDCNMFMPYYEDHREYSFEEIKKDIDLLFEKADRVLAYHLLGGEPFLNADLGKILAYACSTYYTRVGEFGLITNGTIVPDEYLLDLLSKYRVVLYISDYQLNEAYMDKIEELKQILDAKDIPYVVNESLIWRDFGFPKIVEALQCEEDIRKHMLNCGPIFRGLNDGKFYYCHVSWSVEKCKKFALQDTDFINLKSIRTKEDKKYLVDYNLGKMKHKYISFCSICKGCGGDNPNYVKAGVQQRRAANMRDENYGCK